MKTEALGQTFSKYMNEDDDALDLWNSKEEEGNNEELNDRRGKMILN